MVIKVFHFFYIVIWLTQLDRADICLPTVCKPNKNKNKKTVTALDMIVLSLILYFTAWP